jgi:hypothetical protein
MPTIQWSHLPPAPRNHRFDHLRERKITLESLYQLKQWRESEPGVPDGLRYKDFGSLDACSESKYQKTFLLRGVPAKGEKP